jgi:hypothetical protein
MKHFEELVEREVEAAESKGMDVDEEERLEKLAEWSGFRR